MPDLLEHMYCSQQINIPPNLPFILKQYAKAAIRTQPHDLLYWSAAYFRAKADNIPPPVKERLEYPKVETPSRLSPGFLKVLNKQLGGKDQVLVETLQDKWLGVCLVKEALASMLKIGNMSDETIHWFKFVAIAAGHLASSLNKTMIMVCEVLTEEPDGGSAMIPVELFVDLYQFLARLDCGPRNMKGTEAAAVGSTMTAVSMPESQSSDFSTDVKRMSQAPGDPEAEVDEKDSNAGLMVWPDVNPPEKTDTLRSPHYTEEPGASSEYGIEVLDDATGTVVQEVVTIFPAQDLLKPVPSVPLPTSSAHRPLRGDENTLSHSSLQENADWIKIPPRHLDDELRNDSSDDVIIKSKEEDMTVEQASDENVEETLGEEDKEGITDTENGAEEIETTLSTDNRPLSAQKSNQTTLSSSQSKSVTNIEKTDSSSIEPDLEQTTELPTVESDIKPQSLTSGSAGKGLQPSETSIQTPARGSVTTKITQQSSDSFFEPGESVTVQQFIKDDMAESTYTCSTAEIRKGYFGDKSNQKIERTSSENVVKAAETVHQFGVTEDESEASVLLPKVVMSDQFSEDSRSFVVLDDYWQDVPGIGPVIPEPQILAVVEYMHYWAAKQHGMVMPRNINHILCPPLDLLPAADETDDESHYH